MNLVGVQIDIAWEDKEENFNRVRALLEESEIASDSLIVLPEMFATGFSMNVAEIAEPQNGPVQKFMAELASEHKSHVVGGVVTEGKNGLGRNEAVVFDPTGNETARYCKLHPFSFGNETDHYEAGNKIVTFNWAEYVVAPFICYDLRFPEPFRTATRRNAHIMLVIANWPAARADHWSALLKARAIENQAYIAGINRCGADPKNNYSGASTIIDPQGKILAEADDTPTLIQAKLDMDSLKDYRATFPALQDMRDDCDRVKTP
jgi:omega-amidase